MVCSVVEQLHLLEQVSSAERIGTLAENLLEGLRENTVCDEKVTRKLIIIIKLSLLVHSCRSKKSGKLLEQRRGAEQWQ